MKQNTLSVPSSPRPTQFSSPVSAPPPLLVAFSLSPTLLPVLPSNDQGPPQQTVSQPKQPQPGMLWDAQHNRLHFSAYLGEHSVRLCTDCTSPGVRTAGLSVSQHPSEGGTVTTRHWRSQLARCLKHDLSSPAQTPEPWVRIKLEASMTSAFVLSLCCRKVAFL